MDLTKSPVTYYPSVLEQAHSGTLNSIKLNTASEGNHNDVNQGMPAGLVLDQLKLLDNKMIKFSLLLISNPYDYISSGVSGYVMEDTHGREGPANHRSLTRKRRAPEYPPGQGPLGVSSSFSQQVGNFKLQAAHVQDANISLNIPSSLFNPPSVSHPNQFESRPEIGMTRTLFELDQTTEARQAESFHRNVRMRRALANPQDFVPPSILSSGTTRHSHFQSPIQSAIFSPFDHFQNLSSTIAVPFHASPPVNNLFLSSDSSQILHPSPRADVMRSRDTFSSISPAHVQQQWNRRNNPRNISIVPETQRRSVVLSSTNLNFAIERADHENAISASVNRSRSVVHVTAAPMWTQSHLIGQFEERFSDIVNHSVSGSTGFGIQGHGSLHALHSGAPAAVRAMESSVRGGNGRLVQVHPRPGLMTRSVRRNVGIGNLPSSRSWAVTQRRRRLLSEVC